jgi:hypothetical protein
MTADGSCADKVRQVLDLCTETKSVWVNLT